MPRDPRDRCRIIKEHGWKAIYGTTAEGNLAQYKVNEACKHIDISKLTLSWVKQNDFRYYHIKCPYSTQASGANYVRNDDPFDPNYLTYSGLSPEELTDHTVTSGIMIRYNRGTKRGWLCVDDNCYYYTTVCSGSRYFYV